MSNRIDFFQPEQTNLALSAVKMTVFLEGNLCPALEPMEIVRGQWPDFSSAKLNFNPAASVNDGTIAVENIENIFAAGKSISIRAFYNAASPVETKVLSYTIFEGQIENIKIELQADKQAIKIIARDFSAIMQRVSVYGQRIIKETESIFLSGFDTVFNPEGKANACSVPVENQGRCYKIFSANNQNARLWKYAEVIQYLLSEYVTLGQLHIPGLKRLLSLTDKQVIRDLDVTGLSLLEALQRCCERIGIRFKFIPVSESNTPSQAIVFYKNDTGRTVELNFQKYGQFNISKTNIVALQSKKNFQPVTHRYIGQGDFKIYEATFELVEAWNPGLEANTYDYFSPSTNPDFHKVRDVYRKWALNEAGDYCNAPYNQGDVYDLSSIFQSTNYVSSRRRFWPCLTTDGQNRSLGYYLQVSFDDGLTWGLYQDAFNLLVDECGIWLSSDQLSIDLMLASVENRLRFRITASVISDERLSAVVADGPVNSVAPVIDHVITLPHQFRYKKITSQSIFSGNNYSQLGMPDEVDDTYALYEFVQNAAQNSSEIIESIDLQTAIPGFDYRVGDMIVASPDSRDYLSCREKRALGHIEKVQMDFQKQCTNLKIARKRIL